MDSIRDDSIIARRELTLDDDQKVEVVIGKPEPGPDEMHWRCPYQKIGVGINRVRYASGVDAVQSLIHALWMVGAELYTSDEYKAGRLSWDCRAVDGDLGLLVPDSIRDILPPAQEG